MKPLAQNTMIQNRYLIVQLIGKGGMGEVYLAVDQRLGSAVALKRTFFAGDEMLGNAFEREARILARMRHPVLPKVSDHFSEGDEQYLVMEHISGDDLGKRLEVAQKPFPLSWAMFWADQLLDALSYLHSHEPPIIHRDIKPQNLKLTDENHVILLDFGLSKSSTGQTNLSDVARKGGSSSGSVVGYTPHYAPMEQIRGIGTSPRSDLYSLSATLYQLLTNTVPADALTRADVMLMGKPDPIRPLSELNPEIPPAVSEVILRGMEVSQEKRFETAREMQKALRKAYASMQSATNAQTVAFSAQTQIPGAEADRPIAQTMDKTEVMDFGKIHEADADSVATRVAGDSTPAFDPNKTVAFDQNFESEPKQSDLKTEVYNTGDAGFEIPPADSHGETPAEPDFGMTEDYSSYSESGNGSVPMGDASPSPDATMPYIAFEGSEQQFASGGFDSRAEQDEDTEERREEAAYAAAAGPASSGAAASAEPKKKGSGGKIVAVFVGLFLLFVVAAGAIGGGWWAYNNYYAGGAVDPEPSPSPELTPEPTPSPEPTYDASLDDLNTNTNIVEDTNANTQVVDTEPTPGPGPGGTPRPRVTTNVPKPTPARPKPTPVRPKPTPSRNRTVILQ